MQINSLHNIDIRKSATTSKVSECLHATEIQFLTVTSENNWTNGTQQNTGQLIYSLEIQSGQIQHLTNITTVTRVTFSHIKASAQTIAFYFVYVVWLIVIYKHWFWQYKTVKNLLVCIYTHFRPLYICFNPQLMVVLHLRPKWHLWRCIKFTPHQPDLFTASFKS